MTNFPFNSARGTQGFLKVGAYELGYFFCRKCGKWAKSDDRVKTKLWKNGAIACRDCNQQMSGRPTGVAYRRRLREKRGIKEID